jgi:hypothetical protein
MRWQDLELKAISECVSLVRQPFVARQGLRIILYNTVGSVAYGDSLGLNTI